MNLGALSVSFSELSKKMTSVQICCALRVNPSGRFCMQKLLVCPARSTVFHLCSENGHQVLAGYGRWSIQNTAREKKEMTEKKTYYRISAYKPGVKILFEWVSLIE